MGVKKLIDATVYLNCPDCGEESDFSVSVKPGIPLSDYLICDKCQQRIELNISIKSSDPEEKE